MATNVDPNSPYGKQLQQQADAAGISVEALQALQAQYQPTYTQNTQGGQYGKSAGGSYGENPGLTSALSALQAIKQSGGGQGQQQGPPMSQAGQVSNDPMNAATNLGAAALQMPAIYNPTPGQIPQGSKGGVAQVASPVSSGTVPNVQAGPWNNVGSVFGQPSQTSQGLQYWGSQAGGGSAADAASIEKAQGWAPGTIANKFYTAGVQAGAIQPGNNPAPASGGTPTPTKPVNAAAGGAVATPWATAPPAPSAQAQPPDFSAMAAHNAALESAGKAMYSHFGGDTHTATPEDINNFHAQLVDHLGGGGAPTPFGQAPAGAANYTAGVTPGVPATGATPQTALGITPPPGMGSPAKMATGGMVPGRGNRDTVPALLTPGEYVIPKSQAAQMFGGRAPIRMQDGGFVPDDDKKKLSEVPRQRLTTPGAPPPAPGPAAQGTPASNQQGSSGDSSQPQQAQNQGYWSNMVQNAQNANMGSGGPGSVDSLGTLGDEGLANEAMGGTTANAVAGGADVASGLVGALGKAADAYQKSIKDWHWEQKDFGNQAPPNYQTTNFQQEVA